MFNTLRLGLLKVGISDSNTCLKLNTTNNSTKFVTGCILNPCLAVGSVTFFFARLERETGKILCKLGSVQFTRAANAQ